MNQFRGAVALVHGGADLVAEDLQAPARETRGVGKPREGGRRFPKEIVPGRVEGLLRTPSDRNSGDDLGARFREVPSTGLGDRPGRAATYLPTALNDHRFVAPFPATDPPFAKMSSVLGARG